MKKIDVAIIGAGSGGLSARREVARKTDNYLVFDPGKLGTTCARVGCMPSKVFIQTANDFYRRHKFVEQGILGQESLSLDTVQVMKHVRSLRDRFVRGVMGGMSSWQETHLVRKKAVITGPNTLDVEGETIEAEKIIIATGSKPFTPDVYKNVETKIITTDEFFELEELPKKMGVVGIGVIGLELGQALSRLGVDTTFFGRRKVFAGLTDPEMNEYVGRRLGEELNFVFENVLETEVKDNQAVFKTENEEFNFDYILMCAGRRPVTKDIGLNSLGIEGKFEFDRTTFKLNKYPHIFIAGDITGEKQLLHEASDEGKIAGYNAVYSEQGFKTRVPLGVTFSDPNIAIVGQSYKELTDSGIDFVTGEVTFEGQGRSIVKLKEIGLLHVYGERKTGKVLGAELFAPEGEHLAHLLSWVIEQNLNVIDVLSFPFYHPVVEEGLRTALRDLRDKCDIELGKLEVKEI